jgi:hypothetical protein
MPLHSHPLKDVNAAQCTLPAHSQGFINLLHSIRRPHLSHVLEGLQPVLRLKAYVNRDGSLLISINNPSARMMIIKILGELGMRVSGWCASGCGSTPSNPLIFISSLYTRTAEVTVSPT